MNKTQRTGTERALHKIEKCGGDCKNCKHIRIPCAKADNGAAYAFLCGIAEKAGYTPYSNTLAAVQAETIDCLKLELS